MVALNKSVYRASSGNWTTSKQWQWTHVHVHSVRVVRQFERRCLSRGPRGVGTRFHNMATKAVVHPDETRSQPLCNMAETICRSRLVCPGLSTRDWLRQRGWRRLTLEKREKKKKENKRKKVTVHSVGGYWLVRWRNQPFEPFKLSPFLFCSTLVT